MDLTALLQVIQNQNYSLISALCVIIINTGNQLLICYLKLLRPSEMLNLESCILSCTMMSFCSVFNPNTHDNNSYIYYFATLLFHPAPQATVISSQQSSSTVISFWGGLAIGISLGLVLVITVCLLFGIYVTVTRKNRKKEFNSPAREITHEVALRSKDSFKSIHVYPMYVLRNVNVDVDQLSPTEVARQGSTSSDAANTSDGTFVITSGASVEIG